MNNYLGVGINIITIKLEMENRADMKRQLILFFSTVRPCLSYPSIKGFLFQVKINFLLIKYIFYGEESTGLFHRNPVF